MVASCSLEARLQESTADKSKDDQAYDERRLSRREREQALAPHEREHIPSRCGRLGRWPWLLVCVLRLLLFATFGAFRDRYCGGRAVYSGTSLCCARWRVSAWSIAPRGKVDVPLRLPLMAFSFPHAPQGARR